MTPWVHALVARHRSSGVLVDTNILLLHVVGQWNVRRIVTFKRTSIFSQEDFATLCGFPENFVRIVSTPNIVTEVSNLLGRLSRSEAADARLILAHHVHELLDEQYVPSDSVSRARAFKVLGVTDAGIMRAATQGLLVLTDDVELKHWLDGSGVECLNFNHLRATA